MKKYIIHLKVVYFDHDKKDKKSDIDIGKKSHADNAKKEFAKAISKYSKSKEIVITDNNYSGPTFTTALLVNIKENNIDELLKALIAIEVVDVIEPDR